MKYYPSYKLVKSSDRPLPHTSIQNSLTKDTDFTTSLEVAQKILELRTAEEAIKRRDYETRTALGRQSSTEIAALWAEPSGAEPSQLSI